MENKQDYVIDHLNLFTGPIYPWEAYFEDWKDQQKKSEQWVTNAPFDLLETVLEVITTKPAALYYPGPRDDDKDDEQEEFDEVDQESLDSWWNRISHILHAWCRKDKVKFFDTVKHYFTIKSIDWSVVSDMLWIFIVNEIAPGLRWINSLVAEAAEIPADIAQGMAHTLEVVISKRLGKGINDDMTQLSQQLMDTINEKVPVE